MEIIQIYGENYIEQYAKLREACRGIVVRNGKILLTYEVNTNQWFIPGGGLESNESLSQCCIRELAEETGCVVEVDEQYLTIKEHYDEWLWVSHVNTDELVHTARSSSACFPVFQCTLSAA